MALHSSPDRSLSVSGATPRDGVAEKRGVKEMMDRIRQMREQEGFTLIELLIVIVILGVLAAIVVFAVSGISDRGQVKACDTDKRALETAEESYYAQNPTNVNPPVYAAEATLVSSGFIHDVSTLHDITVVSGGGSYSVTPVSPCT